MDRVPRKIKKTVKNSTLADILDRKKYTEVSE
jgi:hypothetical protein